MPDPYRKERAMTDYLDVTVAAVQAAPVYFDRESSTEKACRLIHEAAKGGATLAAFGETWLPGYPFFVWGFAHDRGLFWQAAAEYVANAVEIPSPTTDRLCAAAKTAGIDVVIGVVELDERTRASVYSTLLFIGRDGDILGRHRKLKPTHMERTMWGEGDALGLRVHARPYGRLSGLNCWEHNMMLPGYVLAAQGTQFHVAAWPGRESTTVPPNEQAYTRQLLLSRAYASQAGAYVISVGGLLALDSMPERYRELGRSYELTGDSVIIDPRGEVIAGPAKGETILLAQCSQKTLLAAKSAIDIGGHYSRPDIFQLHVNDGPLQRVRGLEASWMAPVGAAFVHEATSRPPERPDRQLAATSAAISRSEPFGDDS
jgi:nitrilase